MKGWENLPNEILHHIFQQLGDRDNQQNSLTCQHWRSVAQSILFKHLPSLTDEKLNKLASTLSILQENSLVVENNYSPGKFVRTVNCGELSDKFDIRILDRLFPFLEIIDINPESQPFSCEQLYHLLKDEKFPSLKKMPFIICSEAFLDVALARRKKLKELEMRISRSFNGREILQNLHIFPKLAVFELDYYKDEAMCLESLLSKNLSQLKSINFYFKNSFIVTLNSTLLVDLNSIQPLPNVTELKIKSYSIFSNDDKSFYYIMKKFPSLDRLEMNSDTTNDALLAGDEPLERNNHRLPTLACLFKFLVYLFNIKEKSSVRPIVTDYLTTEIIEKFFNHVLHLKSTGSYKNVEIHLRVVFDVVGPKDEYLYSKNRTAFIGAFNNYCDDRKLCIIKVVYKLTPEIDLQPHLELFKAVGDMDIESLSIGDDEGFFKLKENVFISLDTALDHFTKIKKLRIYVTSNIICSDEEEKIESTLESLQFERCYLSTDLFPIICKRCPRLKYLEIIRCAFSHNNNDRFSQGNVPIIMPSACLDELFVYLADEYIQKAFIRLTTFNKKPRYCKIGLNEASDHYFEEISNGEAEYQLCLEDEDYAVYDIYCKTVTKLVVEFDEEFPVDYLEEDL